MKNALTANILNLRMKELLEQSEKTFALAAFAVKTRILVRSLSQRRTDHGTQRTNRPAAPDVCGDWQSGLYGLPARGQLRYQGLRPDPGGSRAAGGEKLNE